MVLPNVKVGWIGRKGGVKKGLLQPDTVPLGNTNGGEDEVL